MANPRKFSEKIALHNKKQAEETAAFEAVLREVSATTQVCLTLSISSQCGGWLTVAVERMFAFRLLLGVSPFDDPWFHGQMTITGALREKFVRRRFSEVLIDTTQVPIRLLFQ